MPVVYVLIYHWEMEGSSLCGIYSTYEKALAAAGLARHQGAVIERWEMDGNHSLPIDQYEAYKQMQVNHDFFKIPQNYRFGK